MRIFMTAAALAAATVRVQLRRQTQRREFAFKGSRAVHIVTARSWALACLPCFLLTFVDLP